MTDTKPRVLVSDALSPTAVQIFKDNGCNVDFKPDLGKDKDALLAVIGDYDGLAIRSASKATEKLIEAATNLKVIGRAGIGVDNVDLKARLARGIIVMNTPFRQFDHDGRACDRDDDGSRPADSGGRCLHRSRASGRSRSSWVSS